MANLSQRLQAKPLDAARSTLERVEDAIDVATSALAHAKEIAPDEWKAEARKQVATIREKFKWLEGVL